MSSSNVGSEKMLEDIEGLDPFKKMVVRKSWDKRHDRKMLANRIEH